MKLLSTLFKRNKKTCAPSSEFEKNYFLGKVLGSGAFAVVHQVVRKSDSIKFACKIIENIAAVDAIKLEIEILGKLNHKNIIVLVDLYQTKVHFYLVLEEANGGQLFDRILSRGTYTESDAASLIKQILSALEYLHNKMNIVHRDLKPENILYQSTAIDSDIILTDFGLARILESDTKLESWCGTPNYVAPEVLKSLSHGRPVDLWALGVITFILLCGYTPFRGGDTNSTPMLYQSIVKGDYEFKEQYWTQISSPDFISRLLVVEPDERIKVGDAIDHPWLRTRQSFDLLPIVKKNFDAKISLRKAVVALSVLQKLSGSQNPLPTQ